MNAEFYETECIEDALMDLFIDHLHQFAELEEDPQTTAWVSSSADRATAF
jgi:hypothetical protein